MDMDGVARLVICVLHDLSEAVGLRGVAGGLRPSGRLDIMSSTQSVYHVDMERFLILLIGRFAILLIERFLIFLIERFVVLLIERFPILLNERFLILIKESFVIQAISQSFYGVNTGMLHWWGNRPY